MTTTIATGIPHTPWKPDRVESLKRLITGLEFRPPPHGAIYPERSDTGEEVKVFAERAPLHVWSRELWQWGLDTGANWLLQIQEDVTVCPDFYRCLRALLESAPGGIVALHTAHPAAKTLALQGHRWCSSADGVIGTAYAIRREELGYQLSWRNNNLRPGGAEAITEDTLIGCYALATRRRVYHPIPTLIDHDLEIGSNFPQNAGNPFKRPVVTAPRDLDVLGIEVQQLQDPDFWGIPSLPSLIPHLGRLWHATPDLCARWVRGWSTSQHDEAVADACPPEYRRFVR